MEETMKDFEKELEESYRELEEIGDDEAMLSEDEESNDAWSYLMQIKASGDTVKMKVLEAVEAGVIGKVEGIRAFIPVSKITVSHVESTDDWVNKSIEAEIITIDKANKKLVLSGRAVEEKKLNAEKDEKMKSLKVGDIVEGSVESIKKYGAFVRLENGLSGMIHISQISQKRIKNPYEVLQEGQTVKAQIINMEDGKIALSMKVLEQEDDTGEDEIDPSQYRDTTSIGTSLGDLLKGISL